MQAILTINGTAVHPYIVEGGLQQSEIYRQQRSVEDLDGIKYQVDIPKRTISVSLRTLRDSAWLKVTAALAGRPCEVEYVDDTKGRRSALFYVTAVSGGAKVVSGGITWYTGCSFTLEER